MSGTTPDEVLDLNLKQPVENPPSPLIHLHEMAVAHSFQAIGGLLDLGAFDILQHTKNGLTLSELTIALNNSSVENLEYRSKALQALLDTQNGRCIKLDPNTSKYSLTEAGEMLSYVRGYYGYMNQRVKELGVLNSIVLGEEVELPSVDAGFSRLIPFLHELTLPTAEALASQIDLSKHRRLIDVGAGNGAGTALMKEITNQRPNSKLETVVVLDTPNIIGTTDFVRFNNTDQTGILAYPHDVFSHGIPPIAEPGDALVLANFIHVMPAQMQEAFIKNELSKIASGVYVYIPDFILNNDRTYKTPETEITGAEIASEIWTLTHGGELFTEGFLVKNLEEAGFKVIEIVDTGIQRTAVAVKI